MQWYIYIDIYAKTYTMTKITFQDMDNVSILNMCYCSGYIYIYIYIVGFISNTTGQVNNVVNDDTTQEELITLMQTDIKSWSDLL